jgi:enoyl-CoA hydratase/carnithine racemase
MTTRLLTINELSEQLATTALALDESGAPEMPLVFVDLDTALGAAEVELAAERASFGSSGVLVGVASGPISPRLERLVRALDCTLIEADSALSTSTISVADVDRACDTLRRCIDRAPRAALTIAGLLRVTAELSVRHGLITESLAFSMLLAGPEFAHWRENRVTARPGKVASPAVLLQRSENLLSVTLNRPERHNAFSRDIRDGLIDALDLAIIDPSISGVRIAGSGPSFCSGGDLDELGSSDDVALAHLIRLDRSVAARLDACRDRVEVIIHGACIGAGIEIPSFAGRVTARESTWIMLPELSMGLLPGAGGTVGITKRIGRWRTAYLALSCEAIGPSTALDWGLIDALAD